MWIRYTTHKAIRCRIGSPWFKLIIHINVRSMSQVIIATFTLAILESSSSVWNPHLVSDINRIEKVQKYFTRILFNRCFFFFPGADPSYPSRLSLFGLEFLEIRRAKIELLLYFKIIHNFTCLDPSLLAPPSSLSSIYGYFTLKISPRSTKSRSNSFFACVSSIFRKLPPWCSRLVIPGIFLICFR